MAGTRILSDWDRNAASRFGKVPLRLGHGLDRKPAFCPSGAGSADRMPIRASIMGWSRRAGPAANGAGAKAISAGSRVRAFWRPSRPGACGSICAISPPSMRAMRRCSTSCSTSSRARCRASSRSARIAGLLISSPHAEVYYHADLPGQMLMQIAGKKRIRIWPAEAPYLTAQQLEDIAVFDLEVGLPYDRGYDKGAQVFDLEPGQMLHWPLNGPHRVENYGMLNISLTISYQTEEIRRAETIHLANGMLRHGFGWTAKSRAISGPGFWAKVALQKAMRKTRLARAHAQGAAGDYLPSRCRARRRPCRCEGGRVMAGITLALPRPRLRRTDFAKASAWRVELLRDWDHVAPRWQAAREAGAAATPFQSVPVARQSLCRHQGRSRHRTADRVDRGCRERRLRHGAAAAPSRQGRRRRASQFRRSRHERFQCPASGARRAAKPRARRWPPGRRCAGCLPRADIIHFEKMPPRVEGRDQSAGAARRGARSRRQRQSGRDGRGFRCLALFPAAHRAQGAGAQLARLHAP